MLSITRLSVGLVLKVNKTWNGFSRKPSQLRRLLLISPFSLSIKLVEPCAAYFGSGAKYSRTSSGLGPPVNNWYSEIPLLYHPGKTAIAFTVVGPLIINGLL